MILVPGVSFFGAWRFVLTKSSATWILKEKNHKYFSST